MNAEADNDVSTEQALQDLDARLLALIRRALAIRTTSSSSFNSIVTGNRYQAVDLRGDIAPGFRRADPDLFAGIPLSGKRFIDLGANCGEKTRLAALAGAEYAEGIEYEEFFVRIGGLISTYNRAFNVVLRQGDITRPDCIRADFDIGACYSAFVYLQQNLEEILGRVRSMFLLETHAIESGWFEHYIPPIALYFPYWIVYGFSDHGTRLTERRRAQIAFTKDRESTGLVAINRAEAIPPDHHDIRMLNLERSRRANTLMGNRRRTRALFSELRSSIAALEADDRSDLIDLLRHAIPVLDEARLVNSQTDGNFGSDHYWRMLFEGILHYMAHLGMTQSNPYLIFIRDLVAKGRYDAGMTYELENDERAIARLGPRLERMIDILLTKRVPGPLVVFNPLSVPMLTECGYTPMAPELDEHIHLEHRGEYRIQYIDGNHRLAAMWLSGADKCPVLPAWTNIFGLHSPDFRIFPDKPEQIDLIMPILSDSALQM